MTNFIRKHDRDIALQRLQTHKTHIETSRCNINRGIQLLHIIEGCYEII